MNDKAKSPGADLTLEQVEALVTRAPYHKWLGLKVIAVHDDGIEIKATWREEWVVNLERRFTHGGILAALVDLVPQFADALILEPQFALPVSDAPLVVVGHGAKLLVNSATSMQQIRALISGRMRGGGPYKSSGTTSR